MAVPVIVTPEASELVAALGMQDEFRRMIDHALQAIPGLEHINVVRESPYDTGSEDHIVIEGFTRKSLDNDRNQAWWQYSRWRGATFSPDVLRHFTLLLIENPNHAG